MRRGDVTVILPVAFLDVLLNALLMILFAFFIVPHEKEKKEEAKTEANVMAIERYRVTSRWGDDLPDDVDLYVADPVGHLVFFKRREDGLMNLDRDDLGRKSDEVRYGTDSIAFLRNEENVSIRGGIPGEYTINVHLYSKRSSSDIAVKVSLYDLQGSDVQVRHRVVTLTEQGQEITAFRFVLAQDGSLRDVNTLPRSLLKFEATSSQGW